MFVWGGAELTKNPINKWDNKRKIITISLIVILLMLCIGISFAVWNYSFLGETNKLDTGEVSLELLESNTNLINLTNQLPMSDNEGKTLETFDFAVITKASRDMNLGYEIKIEKLSTDTGYTSLNDNEVKVYLTDYDNNQLVSPVKISDLSNYSLYSKVNTHSKTITEIKDKYKLRVWIDSEVDASKFYDENTASVKTYQYKFKIGVTGTQKQASTSNAVYSRSTSSIYSGDTLESISGYTTDYTTLGYNYFLKHNIGSAGTVESQEVCYILNESMYCLAGGDGGASYETNKATLLSSFGETNCSVHSDYVNCSAPVLDAIAYSGGGVGAGDGSEGCDVSSDGNACCSEVK